MNKHTTSNQKHLDLFSKPSTLVLLARKSHRRLVVINLNLNSELLHSQLHLTSEYLEKTTIYKVRNLKLQLFMFRSEIFFTFTTSSCTDFKSSRPPAAFAPRLSHIALLAPLMRFPLSTFSYSFEQSGKLPVYISSYLNVHCHLLSCSSHCSRHIFNLLQL
jgi:hypothetical protein